MNCVNSANAEYISQLKDQILFLQEDDIITKLINGDDTFEMKVPYIWKFSSECCYRPQIIS